MDKNNHFDPASVRPEEGQKEAASYRLEDIVKEFSDQPVEDSAYRLEDILREFSDEPTETDPAEQAPVEEEKVEETSAPALTIVEEPAEPTEEEAEPAAPALTIVEEPAEPAEEETESAEPSQEEAEEPEKPVEPEKEEADESAADEELDFMADGLDMGKLAEIIGQNVSQAMSEEAPTPVRDENASTGGLRLFFRKARQQKSGGLLKPKSDTMLHVMDEAVSQPEEDDLTATQKVTQLPTPKMKAIRDRFSHVQDKMDDFADQMYADAVTEREDAIEKPYPETDTERIPVQQEPSPARKLGKTISERIRKAEPKAPDLEPNVLSRRYRLGLRFMNQRLIYMVLLWLPSLYISLAAETALPLPFLQEQPRIAAAVLTWLLGMACATGLDVLWMGLTAPFRGRPGLHTLTSLGVLATVADGLYYTIVGREGPLPFAALAQLGLFCAMLGAFWRKQAIVQSCDVVSRCAEPNRVTLEEDKWNQAPAFIRERGDLHDFGSQIQSMDGAQRIYRFWAPLIGILAVAGAVFASVGQGRPELLTWCLSGILVACAPLSSLLAFGHPYSMLTRRLNRSGAVLAGWDGAESMSGKAYVLLADTDLFPEKSIVSRNVLQADGFSLEKITACTASILCAAGCGLYHPFNDALRCQGGNYRHVDNLQYFEVGGFSADIRGEQVLVGNHRFLTTMGIPLPEGERVRYAVYCVINKQVAGIFSLEYTLPYNEKQALMDLIHNKIDPVLVTRDFNIAPDMMEMLFKLPKDAFQYPSLERRRELSDPQRANNPVLGAVLTRGTVATYADAIIGGRRLYQIVRLNAIIAVLASLMGLAIGFFLAWSAAFHSLTAVSMLLFLLIMAVPNFVISLSADKF